ncbi:MAG: hypothetical protein WCK75_11205, partial [Elusimicrobiota bacterium]
GGTLNLHKTGSNLVYPATPDFLKSSISRRGFCFFGKPLIGQLLNHTLPTLAGMEAVPSFQRHCRGIFCRIYIGDCMASTTRTIIIRTHITNPPET